LRAWTFIVFALAACSAPGERSDWERQQEKRVGASDDAVTLPPYPAPQRLVEFFVAATSEFRFFVDPASVSVADGVVRYTLVAHSPAGANNVSYEGMRCNSAEVRLYALGRDGAWVPTAGAWRAVEGRAVQRWHNALLNEYFCPLKEPIRSAQEGIDALYEGGHPLFHNLNEDLQRRRWRPRAAPGYPGG
jgi:hypothetical protein